jgi:hypothetical protein
MHGNEEREREEHQAKKSEKIVFSHANICAFDAQQIWVCASDAQQIWICALNAGQIWVCAFNALQIWVGEMLPTKP